MTLINTAGRPLLFNNVEELETKINGYFQHCEDEAEIPLISGLAYYLDCSRETLINYQNKEEFFGTIKKAKDHVIFLQENLAMKNKINTTAWIFSAKNNLGYADKQEIDHTSNGEPITGFTYEKPKDSKD